MDNTDDVVELLDAAACWSLLRSGEIGRVATAVRGQVEIFPVNYYADGTMILFRTAPGTKLLELTINDKVAFETDGFSDTEAWSVVAKGPAAIIEHESEIDVLDRLPLHPWIPTLKYEYVRIVPTEISGRRFPRGPEPERY